MADKPTSAGPGPSEPKKPTELDIFKNTCKAKLEQSIRSLVTRLQTETNIINRYELQIVIKTGQDIYNLLFSEGGK